MLEFPSSSVCEGSVALGFTDVDVVPEAGRLWPVAPTHGDAALSLA